MIFFKKKRKRKTWNGKKIASEGSSSIKAIKYKGDLYEGLSIILRVLYRRFVLNHSLV